MIIGISGLAGSGKDTAADFLVKDHGFAKLSFADPMKRFCREVFDFTEEQLWGPSSARNAPDPRYLRRRITNEFGDHLHDEYLTPRHALQTLGTEWGRDCFPSIWVDYAIRMARMLEKSKGGVDYTAQQGAFKAARPALSGVAIADCRFRNEISTIQKVGGKVIRIARPEAGLGGPAGLHPSEKEMAEIPDDAFDLVIENTGTLERYRAQVAEAVRRLG